LPCARCDRLKDLPQPPTTAGNCAAISAAIALPEGSASFGNIGGNFYALDAANGKKLWGQELGGAIGGGVLRHQEITPPSNFHHPSDTTRASAYGDCASPMCRFCCVTVTDRRMVEGFQVLAISVFRRHGGVGVVKSVLDVSPPVAKARAAALISDCAWVWVTSARAVASPVCAEAASVNVPTPCA
jgi:PQQ enzyme repeat